MFENKAPPQYDTAATKIVEQKDQAWVLEYIDKHGWKTDWPQVKNGQVHGRLNLAKWPQVFFVLPNAVLARSTNPRDQYLSGRKLYLECPTRWFTDITTPSFWRPVSFLL